MSVLGLILLLYLALWLSGIVSPPWAVFFREKPEEEQRRKEITAACSKTYAADGNCYIPELPQMMLDLSVAASPDPSHGR